MPIASVASETRRVETQDRANVSGTQPRNELLKARTRHGSACRSAQIVIDHLDVPKSPAPRFIHELILSTLALEVELNLRWRGLANVNDGLPLEDRRRQKISVRHRRSPCSPRRPLPSGDEPGAQ